MRGSARARRADRAGPGGRSRRRHGLAGAADPAPGRVGGAERRLVPGPAPGRRGQRAAPLPVALPARLPLHPLHGERSGAAPRGGAAGLSPALGAGGAAGPRDGQREKSPLVAAGGRPRCFWGDFALNLPGAGIAVIKSADLQTQECSWRVELASGRAQPAVAGGGFFLLPLLCCT